MRVQASTDGMTGLLNREAFLAELDAGWRAARADGPGFLEVCDVDGLKPTNDVHGHGAGDELLCAAASALASCAGPDDVGGRPSGDEFAVLLRGCAGERDAEAFCVHAAARLAELGGALVTVPSMSLGFSALSAFSSVQAAVDHADRAVYACKRSPRR